MFILRVTPIARGIFKDHLSFFSREALPEGSIINVPVRGKSVPALVIASNDVREEKQDIRSASFSLKKISPNTKARRIFSDAFIAAVHDSAIWHGVHAGTIFSALSSTALLDAASGFESESNPSFIDAEKPGANARADLLVLQAEYTERVRTYRNLAREAFARGSSVVLVAPTLVEAEALSLQLKRGIEEHVLVLTSDVPRKKLIALLKRMVAEEKPLLIIGTSLVLSVPYKKVDSIIIERESAKSYRTFTRPFIDIRKSAEFLARHSGARFILADFPVRVETKYRTETHEMDHLARPQTRPGTNAEVQLIDTRATEETKAKKRSFTTLSEKTKEHIEREVAKGGRVVVFAARRGLAPLTVCNDCGTPVTDPTTGTPMILHKTSAGNIFMSHRSGATLPSETPCKKCGSWNLVTLGIGVDRVAEELRKTFPKTPLFLSTKDSAPTHRAAKKITEEFFATKGSILIGTERMLPYLREPVELVVVASLDSMLSLPAWRAHEHTLSILFYLLERAEQRLILETRKPDNEAIQAFVSGNPTDFYRTDILERERYQYPPFTVFIGLVWKGTEQSVAKNTEFITNTFKDIDLVGPLPAILEGRNTWSAKAVIRVERKNWPQPTLSNRLRALPPDIEVTIDPDEIV